jgi:hypothetical protein
MLPAKLFTASMVAVLLAACGGDAAPTSSPTNPVALPTRTSAPTEPVVAPLWRYVNSGWVSPHGADEAGAFPEQLRVFVITSQEELDAFARSAVTRRSRGTAASLERIDFPDSILLAAYYLWRPLQGDPLSVVGFSLEGHRADVLLELEESPQGKEYPYLFAPMAMVAIDRSHFPAGEPIDFVFHLNGEPLATVVATVE